MSIAVSVVIATRNRPDLLARAVRSASEQTCSDLEIIVADDGSSEATLGHHEQVLSELGRPFRLVKARPPSSPGTGPGATRNRGAFAAHGEFIAFLDDDDQWVDENYLHIAADALRSQNADYLFAHLEGEREGTLQNPGWVPSPESLSNEQLVSDDPAVRRLSRTMVLTIAKRFMIHPSGSVVRRETFLGVGGFLEPLWSQAEDVNLMLRLFDVATGVLYLPRMVTKYRLPVGDSVSLKDAESLHFLQQIFAAQHARISCGGSDLRNCARAREAWTYREMAMHAYKEGKRDDARAFVRQSFATYATFGAALLMLKVLFSASSLLE